jgi:starch synthase
MLLSTDFSARSNQDITMADQLNILLLSAEVVPFAKTGGLADVAGALPKALKSLGHDVRVAMPRYGRIGIEQFGLTKLTDPYHVPLDSEAEDATLFAGAISSRHGDIPVFFIENQRLYDRDGIYMYPDDAERFIFFCRAAMEGMREIGWQPDVIHCHDWHTAIVPNWLQTVYKDDVYHSQSCLPGHLRLSRFGSRRSCDTRVYRTPGHPAPQRCGRFHGTRDLLRRHYQHGQ